LAILQPVEVRGKLSVVNATTINHNEELGTIQKGEIPLIAAFFNGNPRCVVGRFCNDRNSFVLPKPIDSCPRLDLDVHVGFVFIGETDFNGCHC
jgi:hypothetical protein